MNESMWGDLDNLEDIPMPKRYLAEQAAFLSDATERSIIGEVDEERFQKTFRYTLNAKVPALNNYKYSILRIHYPLAGYPVGINDFVNDKTYSCMDEETFLANLEEILSSPEVRRTIALLLSQSR